MLRSLRWTLAQLPDPAFRRVLLLSIGLTVLLLAVLLALAFWAAGAIPEFESRWLSWLNTVIDWLLGAGLVVGSVFLIVPVAALFVGLFLDEVARAVEQKYYAAGPAGHDQPFWAGVLSGLRLAALVIVANLVLLLIAVIPVVNLLSVILVPLVNGYLVSREFIEQAGHRVLPPREVAALRRRHRVQVLMAGLVIFAVMLVPVVNLIAPLFGTALMVHEFRRLAAPQLAGLAN